MGGGGKEKRWGGGLTTMFFCFFPLPKTLKTISLSIRFFQPSTGGTTAAAGSREPPR